MLIVSKAEKPIILDGQYEVNGNVLILPITGNGRCNMSLSYKIIIFWFYLKLTYLFLFFLDNFKFSAKMQMTVIPKNGKTYLEIQNLTWKFNTTKLHMKFDNLFNGNKALGNYTLIIINIVLIIMQVFIHCICNEINYVYSKYYK